MITKMKLGKSFAGCVKYVVEKEEAVLLDSQGVRDYDTKAIIQDFELLQAQNQNVLNPVLHISVSFHKQDEQKLSDALMKEIGQKFIDQMGLQDCQYIMARHHDNENPHFHLIVNRVSLSGKGISNRYSKMRLDKVRQTLESDYPFLTPAKNKNLSATRQSRLKGEDKVKYQIYSAIKQEIKNCRNLDALIQKLQTYGIDTRLKYKRGSLTEIQGINFGKGGIWLKGSQVDKTCSYTGLLKQMRQLKETQSLQPHTPSSKYSDKPSASPIHYGNVGQYVEEMEDLFDMKRRHKFKF